MFCYDVFSPGWVPSITLPNVGQALFKPVRSLLIRHFQGWTDKNYRGDKVAPPSYRVSYRAKLAAHTYTVRLIHCSKSRAARLEKLLIIQHQPRDNFQKYEKYQLDAWDSRVQNEYEACVKQEFTINQDAEECPF